METLEKYQHAKDLYLAGQHAEAANIYAALAEEGSVDATVFYGWMCEQGIGIPKKENKALELYESAASLGSAEANYWLGRRCERNRQRDKSKDYYERSASSNFSPAMHRLGKLAQEASRGKQNETQALRYYTSAAELGHVFAARERALLLMRGSCGFFERAYGALEFLQAAVRGLRIGWIDPNDVRLRT